MNKAKKKAIIIVVICLIVLIGAFIADSLLSKSYLKQLKYEAVMEKLENKETFVLLLSQTTCSHCAEFKPKLAKVAKKYEAEIYYIEVNLINEEQKKKFKEYINYSSTPTTVFIRNGEEATSANRISGNVSEEKIVDKLKSNGFID